jgi:hypothetical protein
MISILHQTSKTRQANKICADFEIFEDGYHFRTNINFGLNGGNI